MTYKAATGFFVAAVVTASAVAWGIGGEVRTLSGESHRQFAELGKDMSAIREDVAVIKARLSMPANAENPEVTATAIVQIYPRVEQLERVVANLQKRETEIRNAP